MPLATAARMDALMALKPHILTIKTEKAGGTLLKRTNLVTALGGETAFVSGGLVTSYRLVNPVDGRVLNAGVLVCRTALTSSKKCRAGCGNRTQPRTKNPSAADEDRSAEREVRDRLVVRAVAGEVAFVEDEAGHRERWSGEGAVALEDSPARPRPRGARRSGRG